MNSYIEKETGIQFFIFLPNINFLYKNILILMKIYNVSFKKSYLVLTRHFIYRIYLLQQIFFFNDRKF